MRVLRTRSARAVTVAGIALGTMVAVAPSASAASPSCSSTYTCWWVDTGYSGTFYGSSMNQSGWPSGIADKDSSVFNNGTSGNAIFTYNYGFQIEVMYCVRRGVAVSAIPSDKANRGNSHSWHAADGGCY